MFIDPRRTIISFDMACTLFWEPGCKPDYHSRVEIFKKITEITRSRGYMVKYEDNLYELYRRLWRETRRKGPRRELWHKYVLAKMLYRLGAEIDHVFLEEIYNYYIEESAKLFTILPPHKYLLQYLRGKGYRLILTTATGAHDLPLKILRNNNVSHYFSMVFSTQLIGIPKSDHRFYEEIVDVLGVDPEKIIHIGDSLEHDVYAAMKAGLKTIYYGWRTRCRASDPQPCITDLLDLLHLL